MPDFGESFGRNFFIYNFYQNPVEIKNKKKIYYQTYQLEALDSGKIKIPAIKFRYQQGDKVEEKNSYLAQVDPIPFEIQGVKKSDLKGLSDIQKQKSLPKPIPKYVYILLAAMVFFIVLWVLSKRKPAKEEDVILVSPEKYAWQSLQALLEKDYISSKNYRLFYFELTMIVCKFIEGKYNINAPGQTTEEFLHAIANSDVFDALTQKNLQEFMEAADIVKYAAHTPIASDIETSFEKAKKFMGIN